MPRQIAALDGLALPSRTLPNWKEQFGRVLVEAMACAVPVAGSDSGAIPEVLGGAGWIFPEGDAAALAGQLRVLLSDSGARAQRIERGRVQVLERFTHSQVARQTVDFYRALLGTAAVHP
jgi:glycosyltransferase involved in cell wall biosynthesis